MDRQEVITQLRELLMMMQFQSRLEIDEVNFDFYHRCAVRFCNVKASFAHLLTLDELSELTEIYRQVSDEMQHHAQKQGIARSFISKAGRAAEKTEGFNPSAPLRLCNLLEQEVFKGLPVSPGVAFAYRKAVEGSAGAPSH